MSATVRVVGVLLALALLGCGAQDRPASTPPVSESAEQQFPDVVDVAVEREAEGTYAFTVTMSSPYDSPERYADGWRVVGPDGTVYGEHTLAHDHAGEQPFTRTQHGVEIPAGVTEVTIEGRDQVHGYGGGTVTAPLDPG